MRTASKLLLLCLTAVLAMAFAASSASASGAVEITNEETMEHCNPCVIEVEGESRIFVETPLILATTCEDEFEAEIYEDGSGVVTQLINGNHPQLGGQCPTRKCNGVGEPAAEASWPAQIEEAGETNPAFGLALRFCLDSAANPNGTGGHCDANATIGDGSEEHHYAVELENQHCPAINRLVDGSWEIHDSEGLTVHDAIEINHAP